MATELRSNPHADPTAPAPRTKRLRANGTTLYAEVRGAGPAILMIPGGAEDAEGWRPVAERLTGHTVVTYDRRGTLRSGRDGWPGGGSAQHADDAAALLEKLGLRDAVVFGGSSGGIVALQLALRHPALVRRALVYEPGYLHLVPEGKELQERAADAVRVHLEARPGDWAGAYEALMRFAGPAIEGRGDQVVASRGEADWHTRREARNGETMVRDDVPLLTAEHLDEAALAAAPVEVRFAHGTASPALFRDIARRLAGIRGDEPDVIDGAGHTLYVHPAAAAAYIRDRSA
jgi:pimeloyl-ACP methyl ester carboxylesterase